MATTTEWITKFRESVDDQLDGTYELQLANDAKNNIEALRDWQKLKKEQAYTITAGHSYANTQALPTRFMMDIALWEGADRQWGKIDFEDRYNKVNGSSAYFLDMANETIGFAGTNLPGLTVYLIHTQGTADLLAGETWSFPSRFHHIVPMEMARIYYAADAGEKDRSWDDRWAADYQRVLNAMELWDDRLKVKNRRAGRSLNREDSVEIRSARR